VSKGLPGAEAQRNRTHLAEALEELAEIFSIHADTLICDTSTYNRHLALEVHLHSNTSDDSALPVGEFASVGQKVQEDLTKRGG
jgi:hypothetical protein